MVLLIGRDEPVDVGLPGLGWLFRDIRLSVSVFPTAAAPQ